MIRTASPTPRFMVSEVRPIDLTRAASLDSICPGIRRSNPCEASAWDPIFSARFYSGPTRRIEYASSDRPLPVSMATISLPLGAMNISVVAVVSLSNVKFPAQLLLTV